MAVARAESPSVIFLMGPTASGKTDLALAIKAAFAIEIISVDSAMVYRGLDIGTAKPGAEILTSIPHHLINICEPTEPYSAGRFRREALAAIEDIHARGLTPLLVGGTGLYFRALEQGMSALPAASPEIRAGLAREAEQAGWPALHRRLADLDPESARRIHPNDPQRIQRALEVHASTGLTLSACFSSGREQSLPFQIHKLIIAPPARSTLHACIERRFLAMLAAGFIDEVRGLYARPGLTPALPALRLVGYRQAWRYLSGEIDHTEMQEQAIVATRQLARRQMTWLRAEAKAHWFRGDQATIGKNVLKFLRADNIFPTRL